MSPKGYVKINEDGDVMKGDGIQKIPESFTTTKGEKYIYWYDWGSMRARLNPDINSINKYGRNDFYLYNSAKGYSSGCIECGYGNNFFNILIEYGKTNTYISVIVEYLNSNTSTNGHTKKY